MLGFLYLFLKNKLTTISDVFLNTKKPIKKGISVNTPGGGDNMDINIIISACKVLIILPVILLILISLIRLYMEL